MLDKSEQIYVYIPASSKGFCLDPRDGVKRAPQTSSIFFAPKLEDPGIEFVQVIVKNYLSQKKTYYPLEV